MVKTCVSQALKGILEIVAPGLQNQMLMNIQLARSIVESHKMEKAAIEEAERQARAATEAAQKEERDLLKAIEDKNNRPVIKLEKKETYTDDTESGSGPGKKAKKRRPVEPTGPTPSPTHMNRDWGESGGSTKKETTWQDDDYEPGDVELPPQTAEDKKVKAKAMKSDSELPPQTAEDKKVKAKA